MSWHRIYYMYLVVRIIYRDFQFELYFYNIELFYVYTYVWNEEMLESFFKPLQRHSAEEENDENQIRKCCCDVNHLLLKKTQKHVIYIIYMPFYASTKKK